MSENRIPRMEFEEPLIAIPSKVLREEMSDYAFLVVDNRFNEEIDDIEWLVKAFTHRSDIDWLWLEKELYQSEYEGAMIMEFLSEEEEERLYGAGPFSTDVVYLEGQEWHEGQDD